MLKSPTVTFLINTSTLAILSLTTMALDKKFSIRLIKKLITFSLLLVLVVLLQESLEPLRNKFLLARSSVLTLLDLSSLCHKPSMINQNLTRLKVSDMILYQEVLTGKITFKNKNRMDLMVLFEALQKFTHFHSYLKKDLEDFCCCYFSKIIISFLQHIICQFLLMFD